MPGALVVLEGAEGVGKTTQLRRLAERVRGLGMQVQLVREPGGTPLGDEIRRLLLDAPHEVAARAEALLFMASRAQLVDDVIVPRLREGAVVLTDRFFLSTYAYQVAGRGLDEGSIRQANEFATNTLVPDLTLLLDLPVGEGTRRAAVRGEPDRLERAEAEFHRRVALAFREFSSVAWQEQHPECGPIVLVDAAGTEAEVEARIGMALAQLLPETFGPLSRSETS